MPPKSNHNLLHLTTTTTMKEKGMNSARARPWLRLQFDSPPSHAHIFVYKQVLVKISAAAVCAISFCLIIHRLFTYFSFISVRVVYIHIIYMQTSRKYIFKILSKVLFLNRSIYEIMFRKKYLNTFYNCNIVFIYEIYDQVIVYIK